MSKKDLSELHHVTRTLSNGGMVMVLDTGPIINQEAEAMVQAMHSRSVGGIKHHLQILADKGPEGFMKNFYVGYGHKSIGDLGTTTLFIEGISMLAAKALQDGALYSGQEASTRYIDFSEQVFIDPVQSTESQEILETWRTFYLEALESTKADLKIRFPRADGENEKAYEKAINARAFDTTRGFLPSGASTNLAWHGNLRQFADRMMTLRHHPLHEVQEIASKMQEALFEAFPSSFGHKHYEATETFNEDWMRDDYYFTKQDTVDFALTRNDIDTQQLAESTSILESRPAKTELPKFISQCGTLQFEFMLDFGSFRDIQRHRAVSQRMPLVTTSHGFADWYLDEIPKSLRKEAMTVIENQERAIEKMNLTPEEEQYFIAMGYQLPNRLTGDIPAIVYLVELRATRFVHPTLRKRAIQIAEVLEKNFGENGLVIHLDPDPDRFDIKRGTHDIEIK